MEEQRIVVHAGVMLVPPRLSGDCSCLFCSAFRARHQVRRAVLWTLTLPLPFLLIGEVAQMRVSNTGALIGVLLLIATAWTLLTLGTWFEPARRLLHRRAPRSTEWPPPLHVAA